MNANPKPAPFSPSLDQVAAALNHTLFGGGEPIVVAMKGGWGEGKTYFWKNNVVPGRSSTGAEPGYVSVFGAESLAAIQRHVVVEAIRTRPKSKAGETLQRTIETTFPYLQATKGVLNAIGSKFGFTTDAFTVPPELLQRVVLRAGWTVCLDDIERLPTNVELDALFGYISALRDEYKVNVALIYNEEKIPNERTEALRRYAEKAVDREFTFAPKTAEIVELVFKHTITDHSRHELAEQCEKLGLRNSSTSPGTRLRRTAVV